MTSTSDNIAAHTTADLTSTSYNTTAHMTLKSVFVPALSAGPASSLVFLWITADMHNCLYVW